MNLYLIGIDPGASGGLATLNSQGQSLLHPMPETVHDVLAIIETAKTEAFLNGAQIRAYMEEVSGYIGMNQPGSSAFNFGQGYGQIIGILAALSIPYVLVRPQKWQKPFAMGKAERIKMPPDATEEGKKNIISLNAHRKHEWKNKLKAKAQELYPDKRVTLKTADALLILEYGRMQENQQKQGTGALAV